MCMGKNNVNDYLPIVRYLVNFELESLRAKPDMENHTVCVMFPETKGGKFHTVTRGWSDIFPEHLMFSSNGVDSEEEAIQSIRQVIMKEQGCHMVSFVYRTYLQLQFAGQAMEYHLSSMVPSSQINSGRALAIHVFFPLGHVCYLFPYILTNGGHRVLFNGIDIHSDTVHSVEKIIPRSDSRIISTIFNM